MATLLIIIHIITCFFLIMVVLIQSGKGAEIGAAFGGGSSNTLFGSRGAATFLNKVTTISAVVFMLTSLGLTMVASKSGSVIKHAPVADDRKAVPQNIPAAPVQQPAGEPAK
ncbi:MAG: preprotein translocase subunit SecG [Dissulfurispiraceae bacterium]|nr:preprotein translocase subunit SecG [Dissulfurispiraceae bacterium]